MIAFAIPVVLGIVALVAVLAVSAFCRPRVRVEEVEVIAVYRGGRRIA